MTVPAPPADLEFARKLIDHFCWEDERVWERAIMPLSDAQFAQAVGFGLGSIQRECAGLMEAERVCLRRIRGAPPATSPGLDIPLERGRMGQRWRTIHADWKALAAELDGALFFSDCWHVAGGDGVTLKAWQLLFDLVYRGTAQRADILRMVAEVHEAPAFDLSLMQFLSGVFRE